MYKDFIEINAVKKVLTNPLFEKFIEKLNEKSKDVLLKFRFIMEKLYDPVIKANYEQRA